MYKYRVQFGSYSGNVQRIVQAENDEQAIEKAVKSFFNLRINKCDLMFIEKMQ